jgi:hypothetical protein
MQGTRQDVKHIGYDPLYFMIAMQHRRHYAALSLWESWKRQE